MTARDIDFDRLERAQIEAAVRLDWRRARHPAAIGPGHGLLRPAAVLCPIVERGGGWRVILTRRADHLPNHAGQIAFPGGKIEAGDATPLAAALRESHEEIGLDGGLVEVLGCIDDYRTTGFAITPFVGFIASAFTPQVCESEVAEVFEAPLGFLMNPLNHELQPRGSRGAAYAIPYEGYDIWGATAAMLRNLSERLIAAQSGEIAAG